MTRSLAPSLVKLVRLLRRPCAALAALVVLASCADQTGPTTASGEIIVEMIGLPNSVEGVVHITRGKQTRVLTEDAQASDLEAGVWIITADDIVVDGVLYSPSPASQSVNVNGRSVGSARVVWTPRTGTLNVSVLGLGASENANVQISGPGFTTTITTSTVLQSLTPGQYSITALDVRPSAGLMRALEADQIISVVASAVPTAATVTYAPAPAVVEVTVTGLPNGAPAILALTAPDASLRAVTASARYAPVAAGRWRYTASNVLSNGFTYAPSPATRDTSVSAGDTLRFPVNYSLASGALALSVSGLPQGATGFVTITGPNGFAQARTSTATITDLTPGTYTVTADSVVRNGLLWRPAVKTQQVTVSASLVAAPATVSYASVSGTLVVSVTGVPNGATGSVRVTGPYGFDQTFSNTTVFSSAAVGAYTIAATSLVATGVPYAVVPASVNRSVVVGGRDSVNMHYQSVAGSLQVTVNGLPNGVDGALTLTGNMQSINITGSTTVQNLGPGSYTLTAAAVTSGPTSYGPNPTSQNITISAQSQSAATVNYGVTSAAIDLVLDQAYLTQATQKMDGSVALVAGRDALLRVFAYADRTNALTPTVRARIYDGTTLLQTLSLTGPPSGVPTAVTEGTLSSSWNVVIPGANIRTNTRVLVDIDPTGAVTESNEANNVWPSSGTPQNILVNTAPAFTVRFVPVTVATRTGNVTVGNMNSFLASTRRLWPIANVVADVRATFTSSADSLMSNDNNGDWLTVLSEMNTLRFTDGAPSTMHYYGVVKVGYSSGVAGYGYVPGRAAIGWDYLPSGDGVAAHEWGHNFGRPHAPCGGAGGPDPSYPYAGGNIGASGWNPTTNTLLATTVKDVMGYCNPTWISDYNWMRVMTYRQTSGFQTASANGDGLLVWGRVVNGVVQLEPAFRVNAPLTRPASAPSHVIEALDGADNLLLDLPLSADLIDHAQGRDERQFAVVLPWTAELEASLSRLRVRDLRTPLLAAVRTSSTALNAGLSRSTRAAAPLVMPEPAQVLSAASNGRTRLTWNSAAYPMAMVRDARSGQVLGYVRRNGAEVITGGRPIEVVYSDGVRSVVRR